MIDSDLAIGFKQGQQHGKEIMLEVIKDIKAELKGTAELHEDGNWYFLENWVYEIIDKHIRKEQGGD